MSLKDTTLAAHALAARSMQLKDEAEREAARLAKRVEAARGAFLKMFGFHGNVGQSTDGMVLVTSGDLILQASFPDSWSSSIKYFKLAGICVECGAPCYSRIICSLEDLGEQLEEFTPQHGHKCASTSHYPTAGEALLKALQDYVEEMLDE